MAHSVDLRLPSSEGPLERFLRAYFEPVFQVNAAPSPDPLVRVLVHIGSPPIPAQQFADAPEIDIDLSKAFLRCQGRVLSRPPLRWILMSPFSATVSVDCDARTITVWGPDEERLRVPVLRILEDVVLSQVQLEHSVVLHASAVVTTRGAVLAVGNKGAGKTSILCRCLGEFEVAKMANDNVIVYLDQGRPMAHGWPAFFKVEVATIARNPPLARDFPGEHRAILDNEAALWDVYWKVPLFPRQATERFGAQMNPCAPIAALVFPRFDRDRPARLTRCPPENLEAILEESLQGIHNPNHTQWLGFNPVPPRLPRQSLREFIRHLGDIPAYELSWGPSLDDLLGEIPALRSDKKSIRACRGEPAEGDGWPPLPT